MNINISTNVTRAIAEGRLTSKQINMVARAHTVGDTNGEDYRIQFDRDRGVGVLRNGSPCKASIYIKRQDNTRIFVSRFGNTTSQLGLAKFLADAGV
jgi:ApbE superfamily uncharacterized protein (UPF0280 family)